MSIKENLSLNESGFIFNPTTGESYMVNPTGLYIMHLLKTNSDHQQVKQDLIDRFSLDAMQVEKDFREFMNTLEYFQLIETHD
ncbi:MAG: PqqD family protein [Candidatus Margulisiibacteriota bacterium]